MNKYYYDNKRWFVGLNSSRETGEKLTGRNSEQRGNSRLELCPNRVAGETGNRSESGDGQASVSSRGTVSQRKGRGRPAVRRTEKSNIRLSLK